jgi:thiosulfate dehydrogenase [quinone] large subunit
MNSWTKTPLRTAAVIFGAIAAITLFYLYNPWSNPTGTVNNITTWVFWISAVALVVVLFLDRKDAPESDQVEIEGPRFARFLFNNSRAGLFWLPIRLFVGFEFLEAGWHKLSPTTTDGVTHYFAGTGWLDGGAALMGYWTKAVAVPAQGSAPITFEWYRSFLQTLLDTHSYQWFAYLIVLGEIAVGLGLLFGALTGLAAFGGAMMNISFLLAGSTSSNPVLFALGISLILAWKVAGYYGLDRVLLPALGAPWKPGVLFRHGNGKTPVAHPATS